MTQPITLKDLKPNNSAYMTPSQQTKALMDATGKNLHELIAEVVAYERLQALSGAKDGQVYSKLLISLLGKFAMSAPATNHISDPLNSMSKEELENYKANLMTRLALSQKPKDPE